MDFISRVQVLERTQDTVEKMPHYYLVLQSRKQSRFFGKIEKIINSMNNYLVVQFPVISAKFSPLELVRER